MLLEWMKKKKKNIPPNKIKYGNNKAFEFGNSRAKLEKNSKHILVMLLEWMKKKKKIKN